MPLWFRVSSAALFVPALLLLSVFALPVYGVLALLVAGRVKTLLPLCAECEREDRRAQNLRSASAAAPMLLPLSTLLTLGTLFPSLSGGVLAGALGVSFVAGIAAGIAGHVKTRTALIEAKRIDRKRIVLLASPRWREVLAREQPDALLNE